jgi:tripartite ATP-independent transporter DctM subunit
MDPVLVGLIGIVVLILFIFSGVPVGVTMALIGFGGFIGILGIEKALSNMSLIAFDTANHYSFAVIPLFLLMSVFVSRSGIGEDVYRAARTCVGHIKGGLAMATVVGCGLFAACSGSSLATAVAMGKVAYPEMKKLDYDPKLAIGCIAAGGSLGLLIPPSMAFILIGILTEVSIGKLFMAGIIPGILEIVAYAITIYIMCKVNPKTAPSIPNVPFMEKVRSLKYTWMVAVLFIGVIGGIYGGVFTPTEAGASGAFGALILGLATRRLSRGDLKFAFLDTARHASMIMVMVIGAFIFVRFLTYTRIPNLASLWIVSLNIPPLVILAVILVSFLFFGMFFDMYAVVILTTPILFPIMIDMGFDPVWWGVLMCRMIEIGMITPPFGINLFGLAASAQVPVGTMYRGIVPFVIADCVIVAILVAFPILSTFIPNMAM